MENINVGDKMLKLSEVVKYIEKKNHITLLDKQKEMLRHIIKGDVIYTPRCFGRSMLYEGYADYLKNVIGKTNDYSVDPLDFDKVYTLDDVINTQLFSGKMIGKLDEWEHENKAKFDMEYRCKY